MTDGLFNSNKFEVYYFGCYKELGHHLYNNKGRIIDSKNPGPSLALLDGQLLSKHDTREGKASLAYTFGWAVISFWDRSGDSRFGSNSAFLTDSVVPFNVLLDEAKKQYPDLFKRFNFEICLYHKI